MTREQLLVWDGAALAPLTPTTPAPADAPLLVADSWLLQDGRVRGLAAHRERFHDSCRRAAALPTGWLAAFWAQALAALPQAGAWFPRVELTGGARPALALRIRPAPPRGNAIRMLRWPTPDPRTQPRCKGPDLALLAQMRQQAVAQGADEALLSTPDGTVLEGLTTSLLWWEGEVLCGPDPQLPVLPGVTSRLVLALARQHGITTAWRRRHIDELDTLPLWTVNALHGIRPVIPWEHSPWRTTGWKEHAALHGRLMAMAQAGEVVCA